MTNPERPFSPGVTFPSEESELSKEPQKKPTRSLKSRFKELVEGRPIREDLASRETVNIRGKELHARDTGEPISQRIKYWDDLGVVLQHRDADSMNLKERMLGGADEWRCSWDELESLSLESAKS